MSRRCSKSVMASVAAPATTPTPNTPNTTPRVRRRSPVGSDAGIAVVSTDGYESELDGGCGGHSGAGTQGMTGNVAVLAERGAGSVIGSESAAATDATREACAGRT